MKAVTILSGGMDSATVAYWAAKQGIEQLFLSFDYGQRHAKETNYATALAIGLKAPIVSIKLNGLACAISSALTDPKIAVPEGHYAQDNMSQTVVPSRNAIMLSIAWGVACSQGAGRLYYGAHAGDHAIYPDCRPEFVEALVTALRLGTVGVGSGDTLLLEAPFIHLTKGQIVAKGLELGVPYELTWTCYKGESIACGKCGCCVERLQAFSEAGTEDPIQYADREYWKEAVASYLETK